MLVDDLRSGKFVVSVQIDPFCEPTTDRLKNIILTLKDCGVTLVDINSSRRLSYDPLQAAVGIEKLGIETIPHVTCRDSSIEGLLNQILGAYVWGNVKNFLIITGDPYEIDQSVSGLAGVYQKDSIGVIEAVYQHLRNQKINLPINLGVALNQNANDLEKEFSRLERKIAAGANFIMTQPFFSYESWQKFSESFKKQLTIPVMAGIWPILDLKTAEKIKSGKVEGVVLPDSVYGDILKAGEDLQKKGLDSAAAIVKLIKQNQAAAGVYIVSPYRNPLLITDMFPQIC